MIGPRCKLCKRQAKYHSKSKACPIGNPNNQEFHLTNRFTPRDKKTKPGSEDRKDRSVRNRVKAGCCSACHAVGTRTNPIDPAHIRTWKVTQSDHPQAMISLCRFHHRESHRIGWGAFFKKFPKVRKQIESMGWEVIDDPFRIGRVILSHKEIK